MQAEVALNAFLLSYNIHPEMYKSHTHSANPRAFNCAVYDFYLLTSHYNFFENLTNQKNPPLKTLRHASPRSLPVCDYDDAGMCDITATNDERLAPYWLGSTHPQHPISLPVVFNLISSFSKITWAHQGPCKLVGDVTQAGHPSIHFIPLFQGRVAGAVA